MVREFFMQTERIGFSKWQEGDLTLAETLWGNQQVTQYICAGGTFSMQDIKNRLSKEITNGKTQNMEYWPIFEIITNELLAVADYVPIREKNLKQVYIFFRGFGEKVMRRKPLPL